MGVRFFYWIPGQARNDKVSGYDESFFSSVFRLQQ